MKMIVLSLVSRHSSRTTVSAVIALLCFTALLGVDARGGDDIPPFIAEGVVTTKVFRPSTSNYFGRVDGKVWFSYSNETWHVQFTPQYTFPIPLNEANRSVEDWKIIPNGIRKMVIFINNTNTIGSNGVALRQFAEAITNTFPLASKKGIFLPWLSLCPDPKLPLVDSNSIAFNFQPKFSGHPKNRGTYSVTFLGPQAKFLAELDITNNGSAFDMDGNSFNYQTPYNRGFREHSYRVLEITNLHGITLPMRAVLYGFSPVPNGKSSEDLYRSSVTEMFVENYDFNFSRPPLVPVPSFLVALDYRLSTNDLHANYDVLNDQWPPIANGRLQRLAKIVEQAAKSSPAARNHKERRFLVLGVLLALVTLPAIVFAFRYLPKK